jgi:peptidoglycan hydrolase CwlO-like protein
LWARLKQVEDLQSSYKTLQEENEKLKSKLKQTVDEYDEDYKTYHRDDDKCFDDNFRNLCRDLLWHDPF